MKTDDVLAGVEPVIHPLLVYSWESQGPQYPQTSGPGIVYFRGEVDAERWVDCLLAYDPDGKLCGILNRYPMDMFECTGELLERAGNVNVFVRPDARRCGVGTALVAECEQRWGAIDFELQRYSPAGLAMARAYLRRKGAAT